MADPDQEIANGEGEGENDAILRRQVNADGVVSPELWRQAMADYAQLEIDGGSEWVELGPSPLVVGPDIIAFGQNLDPTKYTTNVSGLVTDIAIDPTGPSDKTIYLSTSGGGVWKSANGGADWEQKTIGMPSLSMGSVALDPGNPSIVYAGTGPIFGSKSLQYYRRVGLYKSVDAGETWWIADGGFFATVLHDAGINRIVLPAPGVLLAATDLGLFRSIDGGRNFGNNAGKFDNGLPIKSGRISDLDLDTADAGVIYAAVAGEGILRSADSGVTFPDNIFVGAATPPKPYGDVIFVQSTNPDNQTFYASVQYVKSYVGLYKSTDRGKSWILKPAGKEADSADLPYGPAQTQYDLTMGVDPRNPKRVYIGLQSLWLSKDGGELFQRCDSFQSSLAGASGAPGSRPLELRSFPVHVDHHAIAFSPASHWAADDPARDAIVNARIAKYQAIVNDFATSDRNKRFYQKLLKALTDQRTTLYVGTDGGIYKNLTPDVELEDWQNLNDNGIGTTLVYGIDMARGASVANARTYAGMQDNGTAVMKGGAPNDGSAYSTSWTESLGGDGLQVAVDPTAPDVVYGFATGSLNRTVNAGKDWTTQTLFFDASGTSWSERALAIERTQTNAAKRRVWVGVGPRLYRSDDGASSFVEVKKFDKRVTAIGTQPQESIATFPDRVWVGLEKGETHYSADAGASWDKGSFESQTGGTGDVECIAIDPNDASRVVAVLSGYSTISSVFRTRHVFMTKDNGKSWTDIGGNDTTGPVGNVPDMPVNWVVLTATEIVIATASGVLVSRDSGTSWQVLGTGLPIVDTTCLAFDGTVAPSVLRAGTYGRGCWERLTFQGPRITVDANAAFSWVPAGGKAQLAVTIRNPGGADLVCSFNTAALPGSMRFEPPPAASITVGAGKNQTLTLVFEPAAAGDVTGSFVIVNNDADVSRRDWTVPISGSGAAAAAPRLGLRPRALYFGATFTSGGRTLPAALLNAGAQPVTVTGFKYGSGDSGFSEPAGPAPGPIPFAAELDYKVTFKPSPAFSVLFSTGKFDGQYEVRADDPKSPLILEATGSRIGGAYPLLDILLALSGLGLIVLGVEAIRKLTK